MNPAKLLCLVAALVNVAGFAGVINLTPFEVVGSRIPDAAYRGDGTVITADDIYAANPASVWDVLSSIPGAHIEQPAGLGGNASIYVRGGEPNSAKVVIDGIDVGNIMDTRGGSYNFNGIGLTSVDRVAFIAGSRSAIHGSDALSGVVSISTMPADWENEPGKGEWSLHAGAGSLFEAGFLQGLKLDDAYVRAGASYTSEDSWVEGSDFEAERFHLGMASKWGGHSRIQFTSFGTWIDRSHFPDDSGGPLFAVWSGLDHRETQQHGGSLQTATVMQPDMVLKAQVSYYRFDEFVDSPGVAPGDRDPFGVPPNTVANLLERYQVGGHLVHTPIQSVSLVYGISLLDEQGDSASSVVYPFATIEGEYSQSVRTFSGFLETGWKMNNSVRFNSAVRYDDIEDLGEVWTGSIEAVLQIPDTNSELLVAWGSGFKKPTFFALGNPLIGNPGLLPEESDLYEASLRTLFPQLNLRLTTSVFRQEYDNLIDFSEAPPPRMVNLDQVVSRGFTSRVEWDLLDTTSLAAGVTFLDIEVVDSAELLRNRPDWKASLSMRQTITDQLGCILIGTYVSNRLDSSIPTGTQSLDSYFRLDAGINWNVSANVHLSVFVDNLLDSEYEELIGFLSPGIRLRGKLRFSW